MNQPPPKPIRDLPEFADVRGWRKVKVPAGRQLHRIACHADFDLIGRRWVRRTRFGCYGVVYFAGCCPRCGFGAWSVQLLRPLAAV